MGADLLLSLRRDRREAHCGCAPSDPMLSADKEKVMEFFQSLRAHAVALPNLAKFAFVMVILVGVPPLCRKIRLPAVVGLLLTGTIMGPGVIELAGVHRPAANFLADLGKLLLMFFAGAEIDLARFRQAESRSIAFGVLTTIIPLLLG